MSKREQEGGGGGGGGEEEEDGDLYGAKSAVTGREGKSGGWGEIYTLQGGKTWDRARE